MRMKTTATPPLRNRITAREGLPAAKLAVPPPAPEPEPLPALFTVECEPGLWAAVSPNPIVGGFVTDDLLRARKFESEEAADQWRVRQGYPDGKVVVWRP